MEGEVKIKVKFTLEQATRTQTGIWVIALIFNLGAWWQCVLSMARPSRFTPEKVPVRVVQEAGRVPVLVWTGAENFAPNGIRSSDRPARSHSPYRLRYPGPLYLTKKNIDFTSETLEHSISSHSLVSLSLSCSLFVYPQHYESTRFLHTPWHPCGRQYLVPSPSVKLICHIAVFIAKLTLRRLMSYIYGAPILDVSRSHTTTLHSR